MTCKPQNFGTFDGLDNRREIYRALRRLGEKCSEEQARARRACFLQGLLAGASELARLGVITDYPATVAEAYAMLVGISSVPAFGLPIEVAARKLEEVVRKL